MILIILTVFFTIVVSFIVWIYERKRKFRSLNDLPGPVPLPVIGNVLEFGFCPVDQLKNLLRLTKLYKPTARVWIGPKNLYCLTTDPDLMEYILSSPRHIKKSIDYNIFKPWLNNGLLLSNGTYWQKRRKILTPAFHFKILDGFTSIFNKESSILIKNLSKHVDKGVLDVYPYITALTLDVICETAMGTSVNAQSTTNNEYVNAVRTVCNIAINRFFSSWKQFDSLFKFSSDYRVQNKCLSIMHGFSRSVIEKRRKAVEQNVQQIDTDDVGIKKKQVFLDVLLNASIDGQKLSDAEIQEEVDTFMFEGHDTTASLIAFTLFELSRNSDVQDKLFAEVRAIYHDNKNYELTLQEINEMKYTEIVLKETMRLYPSVPFIARVLQEEINFKGITYPIDTIFSLFTYGMHRREDLYPNAEKFDPERFASTSVTVNPFAYVPFSAGPRNCIGQKLAMYETKCTISKIIMNYEILPAKDHNILLASEIILKSVTGVHIELKNRKID